MKQQAVELEIRELDNDIIMFNIIFVNTGEIRQKRRSKEWVMKRIFQSELKTWKNRYDENLDLLTGK